jgi:pyrrolidone-carboxylate peptidase
MSVTISKITLIRHTETYHCNYLMYRTVWVSKNKINSAHFLDISLRYERVNI